eukprot:8898860-Alexandrium_andersonii.AAC.1
MQFARASPARPGRPARSANCSQRAQPAPAMQESQHRRDPGESLAHSSRMNAATPRSTRDSKTDAMACH